MVDRLTLASDDELAAALAALAGELDVPPATRLPERVAERLRAERPPRPAPSPARRFRRAAPVAIAAVLVLSGAAVAARFLVGGVRLSELDPGRRAAPLGRSLALGAAVSLEEARDRVAFEIRVPTVAWLGDPGGIYVASTPPGGRVDLVYPAGGALPKVGDGGVGMLLTQFRGRVDSPFVDKQVAAGTRVERVEVNGDPGLWLSGEIHVVAYLDSRGRPYLDTVRLAANVLLWQAGGVTYRLESLLDRERALEVAASLRARR